MRGGGILPLGQLLTRQNIDLAKYGAAYAAAFPGGGWDPMAVPPAAYPAGVYIPGFGPPLVYDASDPQSGGKLGGNPNIAATGARGKPLYLKGAPTPPLPQEAGWKDTSVMYPGQVTRVVIRWAPTDAGATGKNYFPFNPNHGHGYVWHCHIVDHEDNEMMRPNSVMPSVPDTARTKKQGTDY